MATRQQYRCGATVAAVAAVREKTAQSWAVRHLFRSHADCLTRCYNATVSTEAIHRADCFRRPDFRLPTGPHRALA